MSTERKQNVKKGVAKRIAVLLCMAMLLVSVQGGAGFDGSNPAGNRESADTPFVKSASAESLTTTPEKDFTGELIDNVYTITKYNESAETVIIPPVMEGNAVKALKGTFEGCWQTKNVYIPNTVENVGEKTFSGCSVANIYSYSVTTELTAALNELHNKAAAEAAAATPDPYNPQNTPQTKSSEGAQFDASFAKAGLPDTVTVIGAHAFENCQVTAISLPVGVQSIGSYAFYNTKIADFTVPEGAHVTTIGDHLFNSGLQTINIMGQVDTISDQAFYAIASLREFNVATNAAIGTIGKECFANSGEFPFNISLWGHIDTIGDNAFTGSHGVNELFIHNCTTIGSYAFSPCSINRIVIDGQISTIGDHAFYACGNVDYIEVNSQTPYTLGDYAFSCATIREVHFGEGLTTIGESAFEKCGSLTEVYLPDSLESIGQNAFADVSTITTFVVNDEMTLTAASFGDPKGDTLTTLENSSNKSLQTLFGTPQKLKIKKVKYNKKKNTVTLKWTKAKVASGYAISTKIVGKGKKAASANWKQAKLTKNQKTSIKLKLNSKAKKCLKKKGKVYFAVRSYQYVTVEGNPEKQFSDYSKAKSVKRKK